MLLGSFLDKGEKEGLMEVIRDRKRFKGQKGMSGINRTLFHSSDMWPLSDKMFISTLIEVPDRIGEEYCTGNNFEHWHIVFNLKDYRVHVLQG